jgi:DNA-binding PadR family transcriptional regulator
MAAALSGKGLGRSKEKAQEPATTLSATEYVIMHLLIGNGGREMYGLQMVEKSGGKLKKGTIYVLLGRLEEKGYVVGRTEFIPGSAIPRRMYRPTGHGQKVFEAHRPLEKIGGLRGAFV